MECVPACKTCTGLCKKPVPKRARAKTETRTREVAPERMPGYIVLVCGHYTTWEEQLLVPGFRARMPHGKTRRYWCETDNMWTVAMTMTERIAKMNEVPLF